MARAELEDAGYGHCDMPAHDVCAARRIRGGFGAAEACEREGLACLHFVVIGGSVRRAGIDRQHRINELFSPTGAAAIDLADADHVGLAREDVNFDGFFLGAESRGECQTHGAEDEACSADDVACAHDLLEIGVVVGRA
jgi:hypothetical protein